MVKLSLFRTIDKQLDALIRLGLLKAGGRDVSLLINSNGGNVAAAFSIIDNINDYKGNITAVVYGRADSAASVIALSCHAILIDPNAFMHIHRPHIDGQHSEGFDGYLSAYMNLYEEKIKQIYFTKVRDASHISRVDRAFRDGTDIHSSQIVELFQNARILDWYEKNRIYRSCDY